MDYVGRKIYPILNTSSFVFILKCFIFLCMSLLLNVQYKWVLEFLSYSKIMRIFFCLSCEINFCRDALLLLRISDMFTVLKNFSLHHILCFWFLPSMQFFKGTFSLPLNHTTAVNIEVKTINLLNAESIKWFTDFEIQTIRNLQLSMDQVLFLITEKKKIEWLYVVWRLTLNKDIAKVENIAFSLL